MNASSSATEKRLENVVFSYTNSKTGSVYSNNGYKDVNTIDPDSIVYFQPYLNSKTEGMPYQSKNGSIVPAKDTKISNKNFQITQWVEANGSEMVIIVSSIKKKAII